MNRYSLEVYGIPDVLDGLATHRRFTGTPICRGYVYSRKTGRVLIACPHKHRHGYTAQRCAEHLLRAADRAASETK